MIIGKVGIEKLRISCIIGDLPYERENKQDLFVSLKYSQPLDAVARSDDLKDTVDYVAVVELCRAVVTEGKFQMIETLAVAVVDAVQQKFDIPWIWIKVEKPEAISDMAASSVEFERGLTGQI